MDLTDIYEYLLKHRTTGTRFSNHMREHVHGLFPSWIQSPLDLWILYTPVSPHLTDALKVYNEMILHL